jgi:acetyltransferase-like isoleucine patch superfamily enzyme
VFIDLKDDVVVEDRVTISMQVTLVTHTDVGKSPLADRILPTHAPVRLRRGAYIGAGATILQGVEVGEQAIVGAGAVVLANVPAHSVAVGVPARILEPAEQTSEHSFRRLSERREPELESLL